MTNETSYLRLPVQVFQEILEYLEPREISILLDLGYIPCDAVKLRHLAAQDENGDTLLHLAARVPEKPWLGEILQRYDEEAMPRDALLRSPIQIAALHGQTGVVKALLAVGANPFAGITDPMSYAAKRGHEETLEVLIKYTEKLDYHKSMRQRGHAYLEAAKAGQCKAVDILVKHGVNVLIAPNMVEHACRRGDTRMVQCLARHGGSLIMRWTYQRKPLLQIAIESTDGRPPSVQMIRVLLKAGAVLDETEFAPPTAWYVARGGCCVGYDVAVCLIELWNVHHWQRTEERRDAVNEVFDAILEELVDHGAKLQYESQGNTMLHFVAVRGSLRAAKLLLENGCIEYIVKRNDKNISPLMVAIRYGYSDLVELFLKYCKPLPSAIALRSHPRHERLGTLPFDKGDEITNIITWKEGLCVGECNGQYGIFSYMDIRLGKMGFRERARAFIDASIRPWRVSEMSNATDLGASMRISLRR